LYRKLRQVSGPQGPRVLLDGDPVLLLCSNNYLGLADHPRVREAAADAAMRWGAGAGASRLVSGNMTVHRRLEEQLAHFKRADACVLFGSGYLANSGTISALAREGDVIFSDALNHASIVDGCRLPRAETFVYRHCELDHLEWGLGEAEGRGSLIATDGVCSMAGDVAPLAGTRVGPRVAGGATGAVAAGERALARGVCAQAVRPPTVPEGTARLRIAVMASHTRSELRRAAVVLADTLRAVPPRRVAEPRPP